MVKNIDEAINRLPVGLRELYKKSQEGAQKHPKRISNQPNQSNRKERVVAPLVKKLSPNTVVGRPLFPEQKVKFEHFISDVPVYSSSHEKVGIVESNNLIIEGYDFFYNLVKGEKTLREESEVDNFAKIMDSIPKSCGCIRGALRESASASYSQMLPVLHARNSPFFEAVKKMKNVENLIFKEGDLILLQV